MPATVQGLITYAAARGVVIQDEPATEQALIRGDDYIKFNYVNRFAPNFGGDSDNVEPAVYEASIIELATPNFFTKTFTPNQTKSLTQVADIKWTVVNNSGRGAKAGTDAATPVSTKIEAMLRPYMNYGIGITVV